MNNRSVFLNGLLEMNDEEVFEPTNGEYGLLKKRAALCGIMHYMMDQLEKIQEHKEEMEMKLERLKMENASIRKLMREISE